MYFVAFLHLSSWGVGVTNLPSARPDHARLAALRACLPGVQGLKAMMKSRVMAPVPAPEPETLLGLHRAPSTEKFKPPPAVWGVVAASQVDDACSTSLAASVGLICMAYTKLRKPMAKSVQASCGTDLITY